MNYQLPLPRRVAAPRADINITPMIDVLLVLIVIFMAAITLTQHALDASVPPVVAKATSPFTDTRVVVEYSAAGRLSVNRQDVTRGQLGLRLREVFAARRDKTLYILADGALRYGDVVGVIDSAKGAGVERVGIVTAAMAGGTVNK